LRGVAGEFRVSDRDAGDILDAVADAVAAWRQVAAAHGLRAAEIEEMEPAFAGER
jgi:pyrroloquinoline quinone (PQQ) biosynthesis protein C